MPAESKWINGRVCEPAVLFAFGK